MILGRCASLTYKVLALRFVCNPTALIPVERLIYQHLLSKFGGVGMQVT